MDFEWYDLKKFIFKGFTVIWEDRREEVGGICFFILEIFMGIKVSGGVKLLDRVELWKKSWLIILFFNLRLEIVGSREYFVLSCYVVFLEN